MNQYYRDAPYWISLAHLPKWGAEKINRLIVKIVHEFQLSVEAFFKLTEADWRGQFLLSEKEILDLNQTKDELPNNAFLAEDLYTQGYEIIPLNSQAYPRILKDNLKIKYAPSLLYVKGNMQILQEDTLAIVGSRDASEVSLQFTDNIAKIASKNYKVVVSGFAKGVDKQALDSAIKYIGQSIIVLPQGIMTFASGFKKYYQQIVEGNVLVLSVFHPKSVWSAGLAMARNPIIYGLAKEIFVAQSSEKGGTWEGVMNGLKKGRTIYVRFPEKDENNANMLLIQQGAIPVDFDGHPMTTNCAIQESINNEQKIENISPTNIEDLVLQAIAQQPLTSKQILKITGLDKFDWTSKKLFDFLKKSDKIQIIHHPKSIIFAPKSQRLTLF